MISVRLFSIFFFCKQKTAYELRISDWSSDVCSSDLMAGGDGVAADLDPLHVVRPNALRLQDVENRVDSRMQMPTGGVGLHIATRYCEFLLIESVGDLRRSEEHTSELQSLMRISYAVFCLKKKTKHNHNQTVYTIERISELHNKSLIQTSTER